GEGNKNLDFRGKAITVRSESNDPALCIVDCQQAGRGFNFHSGETAASTVSGLTIQNGQVSDAGGGIYCNNSSPTVTHCIFSGNRSPTLSDPSRGGGGMYNFGSSPTVTYCLFTGNSAAPIGGGMMNEFQSSPTVTDCTFVGNTGFAGGGMANSGRSNPTVTRC